MAGPRPIEHRHPRPVLAVVGNGMVGHRFLEAAVERGLDERYRLVTFAEEPRPAYDRVQLSSYLTGWTEDDLRLSPLSWYGEHGIDVQLGVRVTGLDPAAHTLTTDHGALVYDRCVLATGSSPFVPPVAGADTAGVFVYRTLDDLEAIADWARGGAATGLVVGGGLLGLEAADALRQLGVHPVVVELAPHLMAAQLDPAGGQTLQRHIEDLGVDVRVGAAIAEVVLTADGRVAGATLDDGGVLSADLVVFAAGICPRDELGREAGLAVHPRGGVVVDDSLATSAPDVYAIGEVARHRDRLYGLVAPGYSMASVLVNRLAGDDETFGGADTSTKLKLVGVDVAAVGETRAPDDGHEITYRDPVAGTYQKLVVDAGGSVVGGVLVGDAALYPTLVQLAKGVLPSPDDPGSLLVGASGSGAGGLAGGLAGAAELPAQALVCSCHNVAAGTIRAAVRDGDLDDVGGIKSCTRAGSGCASCVPVLQALLDDERRAAGKAVVTRLCEHFTRSRQDLFDIVRTTGIRSFRDLVERFGTGRGCEICKPAVASMFASLSSGHILDGEQASLQDTNDHFLANLQRDGSYSIVPRVPGGEITPAQLVAIGEVAADFDLYTKITGAQRIDLFGARVEQLPHIWTRLIDAGLESGHAYGKALRTVKSCVGTTWCRFGVQDSVALAIELELRYRGLRAPHKIKCAVSGCARECAEAQGKDVGVVATDRGWNLYVGGNGGMRPRHADLLVADIDTETLIRYVDRFLMYYVRTADRLERTATWITKLDGGVDHVRRVVVDDALGIGADLEADMARHVENYRCEWTETLADPARLARFQTFVNTDDPDDGLAYVRVRGQRQPAGART